MIITGFGFMLAVYKEISLRTHPSLNDQQFGFDNYKRPSSMNRCPHILKSASIPDSATTISQDDPSKCFALIYSFNLSMRLLLFAFYNFDIVML